MIQANELRIGNWVSLDLNHSDVAEFQIELADLNLIATDKNRNYNPIPLTEEWLVKFGFERFKKGFIKNNICIAEYYGGGLTIFLSNEKFDFKVDLYSVHQLQNLYFALASEELTIKN